MNKFLGWYANLSKSIIGNHLMDARTNLVQYHGIIKSVKDETEERSTIPTPTPTPEPITTTLRVIKIVDCSSTVSSNNNRV